MGEQYTIAERMKQLRNITGFNRAEFARQQGIPLRTIEEWEAGRRKMPEYVLRLLAYKIQLESSKKDQRIHIIQDENNKSIVLINDIRFKSRRNIDWNEIEEYLKPTIEKLPQVRLLIVTTESLAVNKPKTKKAGTLLNKYYNDVLSLMRKPKED